jgi:CBS domain-containing protein
VASSEGADVAARLLRTCHIRHLPVVDDAALVGIVSVRDVLTAVDGMRVRELMSAPAHSGTAEMAIEAAADRLLRRHVSCLPVVDGSRLIGIFTSTDALRFAATALEDEVAVMRQEPPATQLMTARPIVSVDPKATLASAWQLMKTSHVRHLPVMIGETLAGVLSDKDILASGGDWLADGTAAQRGDRPLLVSDAMSSRVAVIGAERPASEAARLLLRRRLGAVPVIRGQAIVGILTVADFLHWIVNRV